MLRESEVEVVFRQDTATVNHFFEVVVEDVFAHDRELLRLLVLQQSLGVLFAGMCSMVNSVGTIRSMHPLLAITTIHANWLASRAQMIVLLYVRDTTVWRVLGALAAPSLASLKVS